jgi:hypothetical protein
VTVASRAIASVSLRACHDLLAERRRHLGLLELRADAVEVGVGGRGANE